jgi:preprotein translocase subunit YajC
VNAQQVAAQVAALLPLVAVFVFFYIVFIRPQQAQQKRHREMLARLKKGDRVVTRGGLYGVILDVKDNDVTLEFAQNVRIRAERSAVQSVVKRGGGGTS